MKSNDIIIGVNLIAERLNKPKVSLAQLDAILVTKDEDALTQSWRNRIETKMWDGVSDINTASADYIRESNPWADLVYVLLIDGAVVFMQTHDPFQEGWVPVTEETVDAISDVHANQIAEESARSEIFEQVLDELGFKG